MNNAFNDVAMSNTPDDKNINSTKRKSAEQSGANEVKKALVNDLQETQRKQDSSKNFFSLENLGQSFNKMVASATGSQMDFVADKLSQPIVDNLHHGKTLLEKNQGALSPDDQLAVENYKKFKDTISRQIPGFDHDALIKILDDRIAERATKTPPSRETHLIKAPEAPKSKELSSFENRVSKPALTSEPLTAKAPHSQAHEKVSHDSVKVKTDVLAQSPKSSSVVHDSADKPAKKVSSTSTSASTEPFRNPNEARNPANLNNPKNVDVVRIQSHEKTESIKATAASNMAAKDSKPRQIKAVEPHGQEVTKHGQSNEKMAQSGESLKSNATKLVHVEKQQIQITEYRHILPSIPENSPVTKRYFAEKTDGNSSGTAFHLQLQKPDVLSNKATTALSKSDCVLGRTLAAQPERKVESSNKNERAGVHNGDELAKPVLSRLLVAESLESKSKNAQFDTAGTRLSSKVANGARPEDQVHAVSKSVIAKENFHQPNVSTERPSIAQKVLQRAELVSTFAISIDGRKHVNLPVSNFLSRISAPALIKRIDQPQMSGARAMGELQKAQIVARSIRRSLGDVDEKKNQPREFIAARVQVGQKRYIFGGEIAFVAMLAAGGIAKSRQDRVIPQDISAQNTPRPNPDLVNDAIADKSEFAVPEIALTSEAVSLSQLLTRRVDKDIESFAVPAIFLQEVKENKKLYLVESQKVLKQIFVGNSISALVPESRPQPLFRPIIMVELKDTLQSIAERYFNDIRIGWLIADLNRGNVRESYVDSTRIISLQSRQTLTLPVWTDIETFYENDLADVKIQNLVTVVETSQIDVELFSDTFANVIDNKTKRN